MPNADINNQIVINRKIARLYREYKQPSGKEVSVSFPRSKSLLPEGYRSVRQRNKPLKGQDRAEVNRSYLSFDKVGNLGSDGTYV